MLNELLSRRGYVCNWSTSSHFGVGRLEFSEAVQTRLLQVPLHRMRASASNNSQQMDQNPLARPNPIDPWRLPGPGERRKIALMAMLQCPRITFSQDGRHHTALPLV